MPIILARIDDRLVHGQVTEGWFKKLKPDIILVVSDEIASSDWKSELCLAALPAFCRGMIVIVTDAPRFINEYQADSLNAYVLFESPKDAHTVVKNGAQLTEINIGGLHSSKGKREIIDYIYVDETDIMYLKALKDLGIKLNFRDLPDNKNADVMSRL